MIHFLLNENNLLELYPHIENKQMSQAEIFYTWVLSIAINWIYTLKRFCLKLYKWYSLLLLNKYQSYFHLNTCCTVHICWQGTLDHWLMEQESNSVHFTPTVNVTLQVHLQIKYTVRDCQSKNYRKREKNKQIFKEDRLINKFLL